MSDQVTVLLNPKLQTYAVVDFGKKLIYLAKLQDDKLQFLRRSIIGVPTEVEIMVTSGSTKYNLNWVVDEHTRLQIKDVTIDDIINILKNAGLIIDNLGVDNIERVLALTFYSLLLSKKANLVVNAPGFYWQGNRIVAVNVLIQRPRKEELRETLQFLEELKRWFSPDVLLTAVKWGMMSPFSFAYKQKGHGYIPWLYLYGGHKSGKTTLGRIILAMWGIGSENVKNRKDIRYITAFYSILSYSTFPVLFLTDEPLPTTDAVESLFVSDRLLHRIHAQELALAPLIIKSHMPPTDIKRLLTLQLNERIDEIRAKKFTVEVLPRLSKLKHLGDFVASTLIERPELFEGNWEGIAKKLLELMYLQVH